MAIGTTAAILGSAAIGAGSSLISANQQRQAAKGAANTAAQTADQQTALHRDIFNQQVQLNEPFRQADIQRQNMLLELFGGDPVGQAQAGQSAQAGTAQRPNYAGYINNSPGLSNAFATLSPQNQNYVRSQGFDRNGDGQIDSGEYGEFHFTRHGQQEGRQMPLMPANAGIASVNALGPNAATNNAAYVGALPGVDNKLPVQDQITTAQASQAGATDAGQPGLGLGPTVDPSVAGADRFNQSMFNAAFTNEFNRDRDRIDNALANQGLQFSGARMNAVENARAANFGNALSNYTNLLAGFPTTSPATNAMTSAAGAYGANASNAMGNAANAAMQSAYQRGNATSNAIGGVGNAIGFGLGAMTKPGAGFFGIGG
jgi:hypothetical protein